MILEILALIPPPRRGHVRFGKSDGQRVEGCRGDRDWHQPGKVAGECGKDGSGAELRGTGDSAAGLAREVPEPGGRCGEREGAGGRGGRERKKGERQKPAALAASLSAPGLGTKGGTLMNSPSSPRPGRPGLSGSQLCCGHFLRCQAAGQCLSAWRAASKESGLWKVRQSGLEGEWGLLSWVPPSRVRSLGSASRRAQRRSPVAKFACSNCTSSLHSLLFCS